MKPKTCFNPLVTLCLVLILGGSVLLAGQARAQAPEDSIRLGAGPNAALDSAFTYQGRLLENDAPVDAVCDFYFELWDAPSGGSSFGAVSANDVTVSEGYFSVSLDFVGAIFTGEARYLAISVDCGGGYTELSPRVTLNATPYALGLRPGAIINSEQGVSLGLINSESEGGGALSALSTATSGDAIGVYAQSASPDGYGVAGINLSTGYGVYGESEGCGVYGKGSFTGTVGIATNSDAVTYGVYGRANSPSGRGVYGQGGYFGVSGYGTDPSGISYGVAGATESSNSDSYGGFFQNDNNVGLFAQGQEDGPQTAGDLRLAGNWGVISADQITSSNISLVSNDEVQVYLDSDETDESSCFSVFDPAFSYFVPFWEVCYPIAAGSALPATTVNTADAGPRKLYGLSSPQVWIEDFGSGQLENGVATINIEPIFAQTVNLDDYHVFITPLGDCNGLYITAKSPTSFEVRELGGGTSNMAFDYRIVAKQLGYEDVRLEEAK